MQCGECGKDFERLAGRGGRSPYCAECIQKRRRRQVVVRNMRRTLLDFAELIEVIAPVALRWKDEVVERQQGHCQQCGKESKLRLASTVTGELFGLCLGCYEAWVAEHRGRGGTV